MKQNPKQLTIVTLNIIVQQNSTKYFSNGGKAQVWYFPTSRGSMMETTLPSLKAAKST